MVQATVARNLRRVSIGSLDSFLHCWPRARAFFGEVKEVKNVTSDESIWGIPCSSDLKRNKNIFIIGAQADRGAFAGSCSRRVSSVHHFELITKILCHFTLGGTPATGQRNSFFVLISSTLRNRRGS
jgi:hypothetical protein